MAPFPLDRSIVVQPCGDVSICGAFTVALWERDARGTSDQGALDLGSGHLERPGEPDARPLLGRAQQLYLTTTDGCFAMTPTDTTGLILESLTLGPVAEIVLKDARGTLAGVVVPDGSDLQVHGADAMRLGREGSDVQVAGLQGATGAALNGAPLAVASVAASPDSNLLFPLGIGGSILALAVLGFLFFMRRPARSEWFLGLALTNAENGRYRRASFMADQALRCDPDNIFARSLQAHCHQLVGNYAAALECRDEVHEGLLAVGDYEAAARSAVDAAWAARMMSDEPTQRRWLQRAFSANRAQAAVLLMDPNRAALRSLALEFLADDAYA